MESVRSLHEVFDDLATGGVADPAALLRDAGHTDLPHELLRDALVSYSDTAPIEVAEHLAPFVTAATGPDVDAMPDPTEGLDLLVTAPAPPDDVDLEPAQTVGAPTSDVHDLDFGAGGTVADAPGIEPDAAIEDASAGLPTGDAPIAETGPTHEFELDLALSDFAAGAADDEASEEEAPGDAPGA